MLIISDIFWNEIKTIIPQKKSKVGRPPKDVKLILSGIFYIISSGAQWRLLPDYYGKTSTVHGKFRQWTISGCFEKILQTSIDLAIKKFGSPECFISDTSSAKAPFAYFGGKNPTDRAKNGIKKGVVIDTNSIILSVLVDSANKHDSKLLLPHIQNIKKYVNKPKVMITDSAWDIKKIYKFLAKENIALFASTNIRRNKEKRKIYPKGRWRVEQIFGIQQWNRGIKFCWSKIKNSFLAMYQFASAIHNFRLIGIFV